MEETKQEIPLNTRHDRIPRNGVVRTTCAFCLQDCGVLVHMKDGEIERITGDPQAAMNMGALCLKGWASLEYLNHPDRLRHPLMRTGGRGEGKWREITWDEALGTIAREMNKAKERYGPESVAWLRGAAKGIQDNVFTRLANAFGSPNITSAASICYHPRVTAMRLTLGDFHMADYLYPPALLAVWAQNPASTSQTTYEPIKRGLAQGMRLLVIDPFETELTKQADMVLKPRPSSDLALALGMIHVIINEKLYDETFVEKWTVGFKELKAHVQG
jgi:anaerobic selenocysteine-containing dehydrogenase